MLVLPVLILKASLKFVTQCWRLLFLLIVCVYACWFVRVRVVGTALSSSMKTSSLACFLFLSG